MDRLEYIMWRDTIRYKYQLDKALQLSEQEIEEKIDELERTMSASMPYFFEGKDDTRDEDKVDRNMGFLYRSSMGRVFENSQHFISTMDDYNEWCGDDTLLFCGNFAHLYTNSYYPSGNLMFTKELAESGKRLTRDERRKYDNVRREVLDQFDSLKHYPLARYDKVISILRRLEKHNDFDFSNLNVVKKLFKTYQIYTHSEFFNQSGYKYDTPHINYFILPDGQVVCWWGYEKEDDDEMFDE